MRTVHKFKLPFGDVVHVPMPAGAQVLCVHGQGGELFLWAVVEARTWNPDRVVDVGLESIQMEQRDFRVAGTGHPIMHDAGRYIGTAFLENERLVFHVFEITYDADA